MKLFHNRASVGPEIAVDLVGGLGNQLFQYAAGRAATHPRRSRLLLDLRLLRQDTKRQFALGSYPVRAEVIDSSKLPAVNRWQRLAARGGWRTGSLRHYPFDAPSFEESNVGGCWDKRVTGLHGPSILRGYFQSERYFATIATELRSELRPLREPGETFLRLQQRIQDVGPASASLHVRRGDYATDPVTLAFHGLLGDEYYTPALALLRAHVPDFQLFVFTDDTAAAAQLVPTGAAVTFVSGQGLTDVDELMLMSDCRHHVIANSSYSWWGAWLGQPGGMTVAPQRWFAKPSTAAVKDRFPAHWHVVG